MQYPDTWHRRTSLTALPGNFCVGHQTCINSAITQFFVDGHPIHLLARQVRFVCTSQNHAHMCPNNLECSFTDADFKRVYKAVASLEQARPNLMLELEKYARRMIYQDPCMALRIMADVPQFRRAVANIIKNPVQYEVPRNDHVSLGIIFSQIAAGELSLDLIDDAFLDRTHLLLGNQLAWPTPIDVEAYAALKTWTLYLKNEVSFERLCSICKTRLRVTVAGLCYADFTSLPVLPSEIAKMVCNFL